MHFNTTLNSSGISFSTKLSTTNKSINVSFGAGYTPGVPYSGSYTVTPRTTEQVLPTSGTKLSDNVTVHAIAFREVSNPYDGTTCIIGDV